MKHITINDQIRVQATINNFSKDQDYYLKSHDIEERFPQIIQIVHSKFIIHPTIHKKATPQPFRSILLQKNIITVFFFDP